MTSTGTIARRAFLVGSMAVGGGVAFGVYTIRKDHPNPLRDDIGPGEATFNPWIKISSDKVTLIAPHTDIGQGARSMQAALIAEEMDLEWEDFEVIPGEPSPAYYNRGLAADSVPFLSTDHGFAATTMRDIMGAAYKVVGLQITGGSSSVPDSFEKLRIAGAVARETLKKAAAREYGVRAKELRTEKGAVILPDGRRIPYTSLAARAAKTKPVDNVTLRAPEDWRLIGKPMQRLDIVGKSTGTTSYGIDLTIDDMVYAAVQLNPYQGGPMNGFDASAAEAMPGVHKIVPITGGVAAIANNTWNAIQAAQAVQCDWAAGSYPQDMDAHWQTLSDAFTDERLDKVWRNDGKIDQALADNDILTAEYRAPYVAHQPLEPISAIVRINDDSVDVWVGTQIPRFVQTNVAAIAGCKPEDVRLHNQYVGGSFGHRLEDEQVKQATEIAITMKGVPVKLTYSREQDFTHDFPRQIAMGRMSGTAKNGRVEACDLAIAMPSVLDSQFSRQAMAVPPGPDSQIAAGAWNLPYDIPHFRMSAYKAPPLAPISSWRSVGASSNGFFADGFLDELIHAAGADPLEERIRLCNHRVARKVLETIGALSNWGAPMDANCGRGVAFVTSFGVPCAEVVEVSDTPAGIRIDKAYVVADVGLIVDPINFDNHMQGGVVWGLGHAINCELTYAGGAAEQTNFHAHAGMRIFQCPDIIVKGLENGEHIRGIGEPPVPPAAPALANAIFAATGERLREMPFNKFIDFV